MSRQRKLCVILFTAMALAAITTLYEYLVKGNTAGVFIVFIYYVAIFFGALHMLFSYLDWVQTRKTVSGKVNSGRPFWFYFVALLVMWTPWLVLCFPGNMTFDTGTSILYGLGIDRSNVNNPCFQNFLFSTVYRFGAAINNINAAVFLYNLIQTFVYAACISYALEHFDRWGVPKGLVIAELMLFGLCPFVPAYAFTMAKDTNFAVAVFLFGFLLMKLSVEKDRFLCQKVKILLLTLSGCALVLFRNHGFLIAVVCLLIAFVQLFKEHRKWMPRLLVALLVIVAANFITPLLLGAPKIEVGESLSIPLQQTACYFNNYPEEVTEEEYNAVNAVISVDLFQQYNPQLSDPIKDEFRNDASDEEIRAYFRVWWQQFLKHPGVYIIAWYRQNYIYYTPDTVSAVKADRFWSFAIASRVFELTQIEKPENTMVDVAERFENQMRQLPIIGVFQKIGIYSWMLLVSIAYLIYRKKYKVLLAFFPAVFVLVGCCFSPVNGYFRYALPFILAAPVLSVGAIWASSRTKSEPREAMQDSEQVAD